MTTIVLADDHVVVRQGLRALLESDPRCVIVGEAADGLEAIELVKRKKPQVLIVDLMMPRLNGLDTTRKVLRLKLDTRVIMLSMCGDEAYVLEALHNGAAAYVAKESCGNELLHAVHEVVAGRRYLSPRLSESFRGSYTAKGTLLEKAQINSPSVSDTLTARERQILQLVVEGATSRDIGIRLKIGSHAAGSHRAGLLRKMGLHSHQDLIHAALQRGVLPMDEPKSIKGKDNRSGTARRTTTRTAATGSVVKHDIQ
jgi:DNA-binding NarL/FixJ family response regulator